MNSDDDDRHALRALAKDLLDKWSSPSLVQAAWDNNDLDLAMRHHLASAGLTGLLVDEDLGGAGTGMAEAVLVLQEIGAHTTRSDFLSSAVLFPAALRGLVVPATGRQWLSRLADGSAAAAVIGMGDMHPGCPKVAAVERSSGEVGLVGESRCVLDAPAANVFLVIAQHPDGSVAALVDRSDVEVDPVLCVDRSRLLGHVRLRDGLTAASDSVIARGQPARLFTDRLLDATALVFAADAVGAARRALDISIQYALERSQFGRPIGSFQAIKHKLADMYVAVVSSEAALDCAAERFDRSSADARVAVASVGSYCRRKASQVVGDAMQIHGGIGFSWEHECHLLMKRAKFAAEYATTVWAQQQRLVDALSSSDSAGHPADNSDDTERQSTRGSAFHEH